MESQELPVKTPLHVVMKTSSNALEEVVVIGYGTAKKVGTVVGSISTVSAEKIASKPVSNTMDALQGQVAGLQVYNSSGDPGDKSMSPSSYLRGVGSLTAGNEPLYVLDGTPVSSDIMYMMNPNDFASVTVLKDASATSIYGSRAANGVIYLTTKRGKAGEKALVTVSANYGISTLARNVASPMNASQLLDYQLKNNIISQEKYDKNMNSGINTNWQDYFFRDDAPTYQLNASIQGGSNKTLYYVSASYYNQDGVTPRSSYERYTFRSNIESQATSWLRFGANVSGSYDNTEISAFTYQGSNSLSGGIFGTMLFQPYYSPYDKDGKKVDFIDGVNRWSPYYLSQKEPGRNNQAQFNGTAFLQITPVKGLTIRSQFGIEAYDLRKTRKILPSHPQYTQGKTTQYFDRDAQLTITNTAEYKFDINEDHHFTALIGQEGIDNNFQRFTSQTTGQNDDRLTMLQAGTSAILLTGDDYNRLYSYAYLSFFGRIDYSYKNKYFADFSVRNDASSRFGKDNRNATFFSGGLMWNLKSEDFLQDADYLTSLKLKGSVGSTGNSSIGNYEHLALVGTNQYNTNGGWKISTPGNNSLGWETQILSNIGAEVSFFDRYRMELTYYNRKTKNMLMEVPVPYTTGFETITENVGAMTNSGIELSLGIDVIQTKDILLQFNMNYSYNKNKITKLFYGYDEWPMPSYLRMYKVGEPVQFYMAEYAGVDPQDGAPMWYVPGTDGETKKEYNEELLSQATGKTQFAPHSGGFGLNFSWKGLSFGTDFAWVLGKHMVNNDRYFSINPAAFAGWNQSTEVLDQWEKPGDITDIPAFGHQMQFDTHLLENASFLRMKNIALGYQLPKKILEPTKVIKNFKVTASIRNLFTITKYKGADPEIDTNLTYGAYPNTRQFMIGAEISF